MIGIIGEWRGTLFGLVYKVHWPVLTSLICPQRTHLEPFIPEGAAAAVDFDLDGFRDEKIFSALDEKGLQLRLCRFLTSVGFELPTMIKHQGEETRNTKGGSVHQEVKEQAMSSLLKTYGDSIIQDQADDQPPNKPRRVSLGSPGRTSSLCDVSVELSLSRASTECYDKELVVGELKHREAYTIAQCMAQGLPYKQTLLYWLRVTMGLPVPCAYGFAVCGPKCHDVEGIRYVNKQYAVVQLAVSYSRIAFLNDNTKAEALVDAGFVELLKNLGKLREAITLKEMLSMPFESPADITTVHIHSSLSNIHDHERLVWI